VSRQATAGSDAWEAFVSGQDPFEMSWYVGTPELVEQISWRVCNSCEVYWTGQPLCWLCRRPAGTGSPHLESVAARHVPGDDVEPLY
jgi:hypothetical protein